MSIPVKNSLAELVIRSATLGALKKAVFSKPQDKSLIRAVLTLRQINGRRALQLESFHTDNKATHKNLFLDDSSVLTELVSFADGFSQINLLTTAGDCEYRSSSSGREVLLGRDKLSRALSSPVKVLDVSGNDREKNRILSGSEPFLITLGVSDKNGRPHDKKLPKLRQINRFLEYVRDTEKHLPSDGTLTICDLCCGKSYLSFAIYHYFTVIKKRDVEMYCVDLKDDVMRFCADAAEKLGFLGLHFTSGDVSAYEPPRKPDMVVSLHACDTATDLVLNKAADWRVKVVLSTPCCHHELNHNLNCPAVSFIAEHSMLRQKFCDAATDALRLKKLQSVGYSVEAVELVDPDDTPKNILLRAILTGKENKAALEEYLAVRRFLYGDGK